MSEELEFYKPIPAWEWYEVSDLGNVRNATKDKVLKPIRVGQKRVLSVMLCDKGVRSCVTLARLVAEVHVPMPKGKDLRVRFKDGNPDNVRADNLEWYAHEIPTNGNGRPPTNLKHGKYVGLSAKNKMRTVKERIAAMLRMGYKRATISKKLKAHPLLVEQVALEEVERIKREAGLL